MNWILKSSSPQKSIQLIAIYEKCFSISFAFFFPLYRTAQKWKFLQHKSLCLKSCFAIIMVISISQHYLLQPTHNTPRCLNKAWSSTLWCSIFFLFALNYAEAHFARHSHAILSRFGVYKKCTIKIVFLMRRKQSDIYDDDIVISSSLCKEITLIKKTLRLSQWEKKLVEYHSLSLCQERKWFE